jgi:Mycothiol maleylpyruvate isomerase N-terminal domain
MDALERDAVLDALQASYANLTAVADALGEDELMRPSRCAGWAVADVLYHQLLDARRALITFASPAPEASSLEGQAPDVDDVSYWASFSPRAELPSALGSTAAAQHARYVRIVASAYPPGTLAGEWRETAAAACRAARACPHPAVTTQGHILATTDFSATLTVESAVHYLDLTSGLVAAPPPDARSLALVRRVLDGLLGTPMPGSWDDQTYALKGTGRVPVSAADRIELGPLADLLPLFG